MKSTESFWNSAGTEDWTDDAGEVRELESAEIAGMTPFDALPIELKEKLLQWSSATTSAR